MRNWFPFSFALICLSDHVLGAHIERIERSVNSSITPNRYYQPNEKAMALEEGLEAEEIDALFDDMLQISLQVNMTGKSTFYLDGKTPLQDNVTILDQDGETEKNITIADLKDDIDAQAPTQRLKSLIPVLQHTQERYADILHQLELSYPPSVNNSQHLSARSAAGGLDLLPSQYPSIRRQNTTGIGQLLSQLFSAVTISVINGYLTFYIVAPTEAKFWEYLSGGKAIKHKLPFSHIVLMTMAWRSLYIILSALLRWAKDNQASETYGVIALYILNSSFLQFAATRIGIPEWRYFMDDNDPQTLALIKWGLGDVAWLIQKVRAARRERLVDGVLADLMPSEEIAVAVEDEGVPIEVVTGPPASNSALRHRLLEPLLKEDHSDIFENTV